tara:strand:- start:269 stop:454 length:186 start_codon:yes stop_codon:yes gene_type:complete
MTIEERINNLEQAKYEANAQLINAQRRVHQIEGAIAVCRELAIQDDNAENETDSEDVGVTD